MMHHSRVMAAVFTVIAVGGCSSPDNGAGQMTASRPIQRGHSSLVMASPLMLELAEATGPEMAMGWEYGRNTLPTEASGIPDLAAYDGIELRYRERLRVSNGRPREYSTYRTQYRRKWKN